MLLRFIDNICHPDIKGPLELLGFSPLVANKVQEVFPDLTREQAAILSVEENIAIIDSFDTSEKYVKSCSYRTPPLCQQYSNG